MRRLDNYQKAIKIVMSVPPSAEPVALEELKAWMKAEYDEEDEMIAALGVAARDLIEKYTARRLMPRTERLWLDHFPPYRGIVVPTAPVTGITAVKYYDQDDTEYVYDEANYTVSVNGPVGELCLKTGAVWPVLGSVLRRLDAVGVTFTAGYADAASVPQPLKQAILALAAHLYENREATTPLTLQAVPMGIKALIEPYRVWEALI